MTACAACGGKTSPLWRDRDSVPWHRCMACGSDTSESLYDAMAYGAGYVATLMADEGGTEEIAFSNHVHNRELFERFRRTPGRFLDVGTGHGASQRVMAAAGWECHGWDISGGGRPPGTFVSPAFSPDAVRGPYDAVLAREVWEHVVNPVGLLEGLAAVLANGGLLQITTPRPTGFAHANVYRIEHLSCWSPPKLREAVSAAGLHVLHHETWRLGQRVVAARREA
mgnify:CR=1 FL=1